MAEVKIEDGFYDDDINKEWSYKEKDDYSFTVGSAEQLSLSTKSIKITRK